MVPSTALVQFSGRDIFQQPDAAFALRRDRGGKLRIGQMQGFKRQAVTIASIELLFARFTGDSSISAGCTPNP